MRYSSRSSAPANNNQKGELMAPKKRASSRAKINPLDLPVAKALQGAVADVQKTTQAVVKEVQRRLPADWNDNLKRLQQRLDRTATQGDLQKLAKRLEDLTKQVEKLARAASGSASAARTSSRRTATAATKRPATRKTTTARKPAATRSTTRRTTSRRTTAAAPSSETPASS
jgi:hypothetical protein